MVWWVVLLCAVLAVVHLWFVVPRLPAPETAPDDPLPDYPALATRRGAALLAVAALAAAQVLHVVPAAHWPVWVAYLGGGAALVWVDLCTTYLPRRLNHLVAVEMALGLCWLAVTDWRVAAASVASGLFAFVAFRLVWQFGLAFGYGDVRLAGLVGAVAGLRGPSALLTALLLGTLVGAVWGIIHSLRRKDGEPAHFPYGPALWLGPVLGVLVP